MNKKLCALVAAGLVTFTLASCAKKEPEEGKKFVKDETCDYTFQCAESWEITRTDGMLQVVNPEDKTKANVTAFSYSYTADSNDMTPKEYWEKVYVKQYAETFKKPENIKLKDTTLSGVKAVHASYDVTVGKEKFSCETVLSLYGGRVYTLTMTQGAKTDSNKEGYNSHSDELEEIRKTFRIEV